MLELRGPWGYRRQEEGTQAVSSEEEVQADRGSRSLWLGEGGWDRPGGGGVSLGCEGQMLGSPIVKVVSSLLGMVVHSCHPCTWKEEAG